jgi:hypothetical protein
MGKILRFPAVKSMDFCERDQIQRINVFLRIAVKKFELSLVFGAVLRDALLKKDKSSICKLKSFIR